MGLFLSTTGTNVIIDELGYTIVHPTVDYQIDLQFDPEDIRNAVSLTTAILSGTLIWKKTAGGLAETPTDYDPDFIDIEYENLGTGNQEDRVVTFKDLTSVVASSASPGFSFGRSGKIPSNTWLSCETVPSNKAGRYVYISNAIIKKIFVSNELTSTFSVEVYHHLGKGASLTLLGSVNIVASKGGAFSVNFSVPTGVQLALKIGTGSAKNVVSGLELQGVNA